MGGWEQGKRREKIMKLYLNFIKILISSLLLILKLGSLLKTKRKKKKRRKVKENVFSHNILRNYFLVCWNYNPIRIIITNVCLKIKEINNLLSTSWLRKRKAKLITSTLKIFGPYSPRYKSYSKVLVLSWISGPLLVFENSLFLDNTMPFLLLLFFWQFHT